MPPTSPTRRSCAGACSSTAPCATWRARSASATSSAPLHAPRAARVGPAVASPSLRCRRHVLAEALRALAAIPEPEAPPPEIVAREITIAMQIAVLRAALAAGGRVVLQHVLATCRSRTEATVTLLATLELVRRRQVRVQQRDLFGPIVLETMS